MTQPDEDPGVAEFDLERSTAESWASFAAKLADVLSVMEDDATLTIGAMAGEKSGAAPFVAFRAAENGGLVAEASGNAELGEYYQLTPDQADALATIGWEPPEQPGRRFRALGTQEASAELADKAVRALRDVFGVPHPAFLAPDQLAEILTPAPVGERPANAFPEFPPDELVATMPVSAEHLDAMVAAALTRQLGHAPVPDEQGDYGIRVGSTMVFVRASTDGRDVLIFSSVVHDVDGRSRAMEVISDLNTESRFVRFLLVRDRVFVSLSIPARPFVPAHLRQALQLISLTSDGIDNELAAKLRGRTTFADDGPRPDAPGAG